MKQNVTRIALAGLAAAMMLTLSACGGTSSSSAASKAATSSAASKAATSSAAASSAVSKAASSAAAATSSKATAATAGTATYASVEEYLADPTVQASLESMFAEDGRMAVTATGNHLFFTYTYAEGETTDETAAILETTLNDESFVTVYTGIADDLKGFIAADDIVVSVVYMQEDGTTLASKDFTPSK